MFGPGFFWPTKNLGCVSSTKFPQYSEVEFEVPKSIRLRFGKVVLFVVENVAGTWVQSWPCD